MTKRAKKLLFYSAVVVFLFISYTAILYARGYKYSFDDQRFVRTGAINLDVNTGANIYFNDDFVGTTSFLGNSFSRGGLLPGQYAVRITKDNYTTWQKKISVQEGFLIDFPKIMILPETEEERERLVKEIEFILYPSPSPSPSPFPSPSLTPTPQIKEPLYIKNKKLYSNTRLEPIANNVVGFAISQNGNKLVWWNGDNEIWVIWLEDSNYQPHQKKDEVKLITRFSTKLKKIDWFPDEDHIIVDSLGYKIIEIDTRGGINIIKI